jgi:hypothetical protein
MTARLAGKMGWTINAAGGAILRLRCWCIEFAPDGDLRPFAPGEIAAALGEPPALGEQIVTALVESQWLETTPYFRVSSWWQTTGLFLRGRFRREPAVWKRVERMYAPPSEDGSSMESAPGLEEREVPKEDGTGAGPSAAESAESQTGAAHEQLTSSSQTAHGPLTPILSQLIPAYLSKTDLNPQQPHHPPASPDGEKEPGNTEPGKGFDYGRLVREICAYAGARRFSMADVQQLRRLAEAHGEELVQACRHLHGGIVNVPAYLRTVFEGSNRDKIERISLMEFMRRRGKMG